MSAAKELVKIPVDLRQLKRHPLSAEYRDITGTAWTSFCLKMKRVGFLKAFPIILHDGMVLDGWQRLRVCIETGIEPTFDGLPDGISPEDYVESVNDERRHETPEERDQRIAARRERVAEARQEGQSLRTIASGEEISEATVRNDLEAATAQGYAVEPKDGKIKGADGRMRTATPLRPAPILCERCQRGQVKDCQMCRELREKKPVKHQPTKSGKPEADIPVDAFQTPLPKNCRKAYLDPFLQESFDFLVVMESNLRRQRIADGFVKRKEAYPFIKTKDIVDGIGQVMNDLDAIIQHIKANRPAGVCPLCEGEGCGKGCKMSGLVPRELHAELKAKAKEK